MACSLAFRRHGESRHDVRNHPASRGLCRGLDSVHSLLKQKLIRHAARNGLDLLQDGNGRFQMKFVVSGDLIVPFLIEVEADSAEQACDKAAEMPVAKLLELADTSDGAVDISVNYADED